MLIGGWQENRPVLQAVFALAVDLPRQPLLDLVSRVTARRDVARDMGIAPERDGERNVACEPATKTEPGTAKEAVRHAISK